jgi:hypothetical protein
MLKIQDFKIGDFHKARKAWEKAHLHYISMYNYIQLGFSAFIQTQVIEICNE